MPRIDVHNHFLPALDDGCKSLDDSLTCLRMMAHAGYDRLFCTPHYGDVSFYTAPIPEVKSRLASLQAALDAANIPLQLRPGGEIRLSPDMIENFQRHGIPSYGHALQHVLCDLWEDTWPAWATRCVEWLQAQGLAVILAHPERMPHLRKNPRDIAELARLGLLFQGNLGPLGGADNADIVAAAEFFLKEGRYFMVSTDGHRPSHLPQRLAGLARVEKLVGAAAFAQLTETNPAEIWTAADGT